MPGPLPQLSFHKGDTLKASDLQAIVDELRRLQRLMGSRGVRVYQGMAGDQLALELPEDPYGFLAAGATITGADPTTSPMTLGTGTVTLCSRSGAQLTADGVSVTVYNAGGAFTAGSSGRIVGLVWRDGELSVDVARCS